MDFKALAEQYCKKLVLVYHFEAPDEYPIKFTSGLDILKEKNQQETPPRISYNNQKLVKSSQKSNRIQLIAEDLLPIKEGGYFFRPEKQIYNTIFEFVEKNVSKYDMGSLFNTITWQDFEIFLSQALNHYGFHSFRTFRFKLEKKRHEVDIIARERNIVLFIDAKHWNNRTASRSALSTAALEQKKRAEHLVQNPMAAGRMVTQLGFPKDQKFEGLDLYPMIIVSSAFGTNRIEEGVAIISITAFNIFLNKFPAIKHQLKPIRLSKIIYQKTLK